MDYDIREVAEILRGFGYSRAWLVPRADPVEEVILVPREELDEKEVQRHSIDLMVKMPHHKVYLLPYRDGLSATRIY
jgi:hypothetical protein